MPDAFKIDGPTAGRLDKLLRDTYGAGLADAPGLPPGTRSSDSCWAKLGSQTTDTSGAWTWAECVPTLTEDAPPKIEWATIVARKGDNTPTEEENKGLAHELVKGTGANGKIVLLRRMSLRQKVSEIAPGTLPKWYVRWVIVAPLPASAVLVKCTDDLSHGQAYVKAKRYVVGAGVTGDELIITVIHHTTLNDVFYAYPVPNPIAPATDPTFVQIGYPPIRSQFMVLQINDASGGPQAVDFDWPKGH